MLSWTTIPIIKCVPKAASFSNSAGNRLVAPVNRHLNFIASALAH
jgi:hypothetical protein